MPLWQEYLLKLLNIMTDFPPRKVFIFTFILLIAYLTLDFYLKSKRYFPQLNFNWSNITIINTFKNIQIDSLGINYLSVKNNTQIDVDRLDFQNTFSINNKYYFRCKTIKVKDDNLIFSGGYWINTLPKTISNNVTLEEIDLPLIQNGDINVCMIGDSQLTYKTGKFTRQKLYSNLKNITFVGNEKDLYAYPYCATTLNNTSNLLETFDRIPNADIYIIYLGAHEKNIELFKKNITNIINRLNNKNKRLLLVIPPKYKNPNKKGIYQAVKNIYINYESNPNVEVINLSELTEESSRILLPDGIHLNKYGHQLFIEILTNQLKKYEGK